MALPEKSIWISFVLYAHSTYALFLKNFFLIFPNSLIWFSFILIWLKKTKLYFCKLLWTCCWKISYSYQLLFNESFKNFKAESIPGFWSRVFGLIPMKSIPIIDSIFSNRDEEHKYIWISRREVFDLLLLKQDRIITWTNIALYL